MREVDGKAYGDELRPFFEDGDTSARARDHRAHAFKYVRPALALGKSRAHVRLATTDILLGAVQLFTSGGEHIMHAHTALDGFWMVLSGRARFHFDGQDDLDAGPLEGVCVPRDVRYSFEKISEEPLEILQVEARHPTIQNKMLVANATAEESERESQVMAFFDGKSLDAVR